MRQVLCCAHHHENSFRLQSPPQFDSPVDWTFLMFCVISQHPLNTISISSRLVKINWKIVIIFNIFDKWRILISRRKQNKSRNFLDNKGCHIWYYIQILHLMLYILIFQNYDFYHSCWQPRSNRYVVYVLRYPSFALSLKIIKSKNYILSVVMILETSIMHCAFIIQVQLPRCNNVKVHCLYQTFS